MKRDTLQNVLSHLQTKLAAEPSEEISLAEMQEFWTTMAASFLAATASLGECRRAKPYSTLRPVIDHDGRFKWCCNHDPEHCSS